MFNKSYSNEYIFIFYMKVIAYTESCIFRCRYDVRPTTFLIHIAIPSFIFFRNKVNIIKKNCKLTIRNKIDKTIYIQIHTIKNKSLLWTFANKFKKIHLYWFHPIAKVHKFWYTLVFCWWIQIQSYLSFYRILYIYIEV